MSHLTEEALIAHAYGEADQAAVNAHLDHCAACSSAYAALRSDLADIRLPDPPARDADYGEQVWASLAASLSAYPARRKPLYAITHWKGLGFAAACLLLGVFAFAGGRAWERKHAEAGARQAARHNQPAVPVPQRVVVVVLGDHLDRSESLLVQLKHAEAGNSEMVYPLREEAQSLLDANRVCRQNAEHAEDSALATALDRLDHLLQELASQPGGLSPATLTRLQHEMDANGLLFEVRVLRSRLPNQPATAGVEVKGGKV